jgi:hypothetical protein
MVNMTNRPDVAVRLRPLKLRLRHSFPAFLSEKEEPHPIKHPYG